MSRDGGNPLAQACLFASVATLGQALQIHDGFYDERAIGWLTGALILCAAGVVSLRWSLAPAWRLDLLPRIVAAVAIAWHAALLLTSSPGMYVQPRANIQLFNAGIVAQAGLAAIGVPGLKRLSRLWFPPLLAVHYALGVWMIHASPSPAIDVVVVHREAIDAMAEGRSPYAINFENIYSADSGFYNPEAVSGNRVMFGYPYPPLNLIAALPARWLTGDYRYAQLAAWIAAAALVGFSGQGIVSKLAAVLLLLQPRGFFVLEQGWTEPLAVFMLALTLFAMARVPSLTAWAGGLLIVTKQYLVLAVPLLWRFAAGGRGARGFIVRAVVVGSAVTLPFLLWSPRAFIESVVLLQLREPVRLDSLSYLSWAARHGLGMGSFVWAAGAAAIAVAVTMLATPNTAAGFAASLAFSSFATFAFGSKAFCNYYFFVAGAMCCAIAARDVSRVFRPGDPS
jgi:hypothetical protein